MICFDQIMPIMVEILQPHTPLLSSFGKTVINRDLNGRVRLIILEKTQEHSAAKQTIETIAKEMLEKLEVHTYPLDRVILFEENIESILQNSPSFAIDGLKDVFLIDRLATETNWASIELDSTKSKGPPRIVFFSIKGGVGRSTALAVTAWSLAQAGKRVLVLDLDLESPGLSSSLLPSNRRPDYGITDWLVEDLVDNGAAVFEDMAAISELSHDGEIYVVPAHGRKPGEYINKLGRIWMPKVHADGTRESWSKRLTRLLNDLEQRWRPEVILIDSRAGIDEVASACITSLGAHDVLLFGIDAEQTWLGYQILFEHWHKTGVVHDIRERLQLVGAMIPEIDESEYFDRLREQAWNVFAEELYDEVPPGKLTGEYFSFEEHDEEAPHYPWPIRWHRAFAALQSVHSRFQRFDHDQINAIFGRLIEGIKATLADNESEQYD